MKARTDDPIVVRVSPIVHASEQLRSLMDQKIDSDVILDVSDLGFATSMLLNELLELRTSVTRSGHQLIICCVDERVRGILNVTELDNVFTIVDSQKEAFAALDEPNPSQTEE